MLIPYRVMAEAIRDAITAAGGQDPAPMRVFATPTQIKSWQAEMAKAGRTTVTSTTPLPTTVAGVPIITVQVDPPYIGWPAYPQPYGA